MIGLKRGTVKLMPHQKEWEENAGKTIENLKQLLGSAAADIQHVGSTSISSIHAKPIIDLAVGVSHLRDIMPLMESLRQNGFLFRGEDVSGQLLFVMGDLEKDLRTHHIHVVRWKGKEWNDYINFRDYLNAFPLEAAQYDACKRDLAVSFANCRRRYTEGKRRMIEDILAKAAVWKSQQPALPAKFGEEEQTAMDSLTDKDRE